MRLALQTAIDKVQGLDSPEELSYLIGTRDMREQVNKYMTSVLQEKPVDPTLVDFDDTQAW